MSHPFGIMAVLFGAATLVLIFQRPLAKWYRKVRRRRGGVYLWRVDHHRNRARRVNGYVGETVSFYFRSKQHMGMSHYPVEAGKRAAVAVKVPSQPWSDLNPKMHKVIKLPWWLCWKWVLHPLETLVIFCTWPIYNDAKNRWNPRRIPKDLAAMQRRTRDNMAAHGMAYPVRVWTAHFLRRALTVGLVLVACLGAYTWSIYR